jgi:hypothetical protein
MDAHSIHQHKASRNLWRVCMTRDKPPPVSGTCATARCRRVWERAPAAARRGLGIEEWPPGR